MTERQATDRQLAFIAGLVQERDVPAKTQAAIKWVLENPRDNTGVFSVRDASEMIDALLALPKTSTHGIKVRTPLGTYLVPQEEVDPSTLSFTAPESGVIIYVNEYRGRTYMRRLKPGGIDDTFVQDRLTRFEAEHFDAIIAPDPEKYARLFMDHYTMCARCRSVLPTPPPSRCPNCRRPLR